MITPEIKDKVLNGLVQQNSINLSQDIHKAESDFGITPDMLEVILDNFEDLGFIEQNKCLGGLILVTMKVPAYDFYHRGGFVAQEEILRANLQKLDYELTKLSQDIDPGLTDRIVKITGIAASIATALSLFKG